MDCGDTVLGMLSRLLDSTRLMASLSFVTSNDESTFLAMSNVGCRLTQPRSILLVFSVMIRLATESVTEKEIQDVLWAAEQTLGQVAEFTVVPDDRTIPSAYGYMIELAGELGRHFHNNLCCNIPDGTSCFPSRLSGADAHLAPKALLDNLCACNENFNLTIGWGRLLPPTIRIVKPGTFREYRQLKIETSKVGSGQVKVPVVTWDENTKKWLMERVIQEL